MNATVHTLFFQVIKYLLKFLLAVSGKDDTIHLIKCERLKKSLSVCDDREYNLSPFLPQSYSLPAQISLQVLPKGTVYFYILHITY